MAKEYIEREAAVETLDWYGREFPECETMIVAYREDLTAFPAADVRPVVTCRECKHRGWVQEPCHGKSVDYCRILDRCVDKEFFCAGGEMREAVTACEQ